MPAPSGFVPSDEQKSPGSSTKGRCQYTLRGLMLLVLLVAMALSLIATVRRLWNAEAQLADYRREYGILSAEEPMKLSAVACWAPEPNHWRWRVHFPSGKFAINCTNTKITAGNVPNLREGIRVEDQSGIVEISVTVFQDPNDSKWKYHLSVTSGACTQFWDLGTPPGFPVERNSVTSGVQWGQSATIVSPERPLVLLRKRLIKGSQLSDSDPTDGLMIWIERMKK